MARYPRDAVEEYDHVEIDDLTEGPISLAIGNWIYEGDEPLYRIDRIYRTDRHEDLYWLVLTDPDGRTHDNIAALSVLVQQNPDSGERWVKQKGNLSEE